MNTPINIDYLLSNLGEWLRSTGPDVDVVVSTRIRLARNLTGLPFTMRASKQQKAESESRVKSALAQAGFQPKLEYFSVEKMPVLDRQLLVERQLISRELASALEGPRGVAFDERESVSVMVNEEDHLRIQVMRSGLALDEAWDEINHVDDQLEAHLDYAFHDRFGYLTSCPTNVGTGLRASVMLHLPALGITKQLDKVFKALQKLNLVVRGLYGEGSRASGDLYQISNQVTLGKSEPKLLEEIREVMASILAYERSHRQMLLKDRRQAEQDRVARAIGTLSSATLITSDETMELLSAVRLGIHLNLLDDLPATTLNQLFINCQAAHLQKIEGSELDGQQRNAARARYLRKCLRNLGGQ
jgi:protein arginine kinase